VSFDSLLIHTVSIRTPSPNAGADRYGNPTEDPGTPVDVPARVEQRAASEDVIDRDTRVTRALVFLPTGTNISALSVVAYEGQDWQVVGAPYYVANGAGPHHIQAVIELIEG